MKRFYCLAFLIISLSSVLAQSPVQHKKTGAQTPVISSYVGGRIDTCLDKTYSIVFYVIQDSIGLRTTSTTSVNTWINNLLSILNQKFKPICLQFRNCSTVVVPHWQQNSWIHPTTTQAMIPSWYTEDVINVYLPEHAAPFSFETGGFAFATSVTSTYSSTRTAIVLATDTFSGNDNFVEPIHIFGHFFGLNETYLEIDQFNPPSPTNPAISQEYVDGSNCATHGDGICDTEADCWPQQYIPPPAQDGYTYRYNCDYQRDYKDGKGLYYTPPLDNYMSVWPCRCRFTQEQYQKMAWYALQYRWYLH